MTRTDQKNLERAASDNFIKLMPAFYEMQSVFMSGVYKRYGDLEGSHIVLYFARDLHLQILRKREQDLGFDLSLDEFWNNHKNILQTKKKIILISKVTGLPKETARRKIITLIKNKHLKKIDKNRIYWEPTSELKSTYIKIIEEQIKSLSKFVFEQLRCMDFNIPFARIEKEIKKNYSFYWYHYLSVQLEYIKFWQSQLKDLEILLIGLQAVIQTVNYVSKNIGTDLNSFVEGKLPKNMDFSEANISATSISEVTNIPRATCIRKLEKLVNMDILYKSKNTKRYYLALDNLDENPKFNFMLGVKRTIEIFSHFSSIVLKGLSK